MLYGDDAAAIGIGSEGVIAEFVAYASVSDDFPDEWRRDTDTCVRGLASKYSVSRGFEANLIAAVQTVLEKSGTTAEQLTRVAFSTPDGRAHLTVAKTLGVDAGKLADPLIHNVGITGTAMP